jgi:hypothetical protein
LAGAIQSEVSEFLDIQGASGASYRFRRASFDAMPAGAGNVLAITGSTAKPKVLLCGAARSLARAMPALREALREKRNVTVFVRLNVASSVRNAEHADIAEATAPEQVLSDLD